MTIIRQFLEDLRADIDSSTRAAVNDAISYFERENDLASVRSGLVDRYAVGIDKIEGEAGGYTTYVKGKAAAAIDEGLHEAITTGWGVRVASTLANIFNNRSQNYSWVKPVETTDDEGNTKTELEKVEDTERKISKLRKDGGYNQQMIAADYVSCTVETGPMEITYRGKGLGYRTFSPSGLWIFHGDKVEDDNTVRGADPTELEDAHHIIIELSSNKSIGSGSAINRKYRAIFGRSDKYPYGRHVDYEARNAWDVPKVDASNEAITDWTTPKGEIANPLSWLEETEHLGFPEYPIILIRGGMVATADTVMPLVTSLYDSAAEIDVDESRVLHTAILGARGTDKLTNPNGGPLPRSLEGAVNLVGTDMDYDIIGRDVTNSVNALEVIQTIATNIAEGYSVPNYLATTRTGALDTSGVALLVQTQPLINYRDYRIGTNESQVQRVWGIEQGLYKVFTGELLAEEGVEQIWDAGRHEVPETKLDKSTRLAAEVEAGLIDYVSAVKEMHGLRSDSEAKALIDKWEARAADYPKPGGAAPAAGGLGGLLPPPKVL